MPAQLRAGPPGFFEATGSRVAPSFGDSATLLPNGKVLAAGELYDPASGTWAMTANAGHLRADIAAQRQGADRRRIIF